MWASAESSAARRSSAISVASLTSRSWWTIGPASAIGRGAVAFALPAFQAGLQACRGRRCRRRRCSRALSRPLSAPATSSRSSSDQVRLLGAEVRLRAIDAGAPPGPLLLREVPRRDEEHVTLALGRARAGCTATASASEKPVRYQKSESWR